VTVLRLVSLRHQSDVMSDTLVDYHVAPTAIIDTSLQSMSDTLVDYHVAPTAIIDTSVQSYQLGRSHGFLTFWFDSHFC